MSVVIVIFAIIILLALDEVLRSGISDLSQYEQDFDR